MELTPNVFMSVIAGPGFYSTPGGIGSDDSKFKNKPSVKDFSSFEVGIIDENLPEDEQQFEVTGWMGRDEINTLIGQEVAFPIAANIGDESHMYNHHNHTQVHISHNTQ